jgi:hypothetical protein
MKTLLRNSREYLVNSLSEFILSEIPSNENSIIQVVDCENFYVVKGKTSYKEILDLNKIKDNFYTQNPDLKNEKKLLNTIDLVDYGCKLEESNKFSDFFYNTENCSFKKEIFEKESELVVSSHFPFGYSLDMGRLLYFFAKKLVYNIPPNLIFEKLLVTVRRDKGQMNISFQEEDGTVLETLNSLFLDCADLNVQKFRKEVIESNWSEELKFYEKDLDFLKNKIKGIISI